MKSRVSSDTTAPGRPPEIEAPTNRLLIHPLARALVDVLLRTPVTPNQVSVASTLMAGTGAAAYLLLPWPWNAPVGLLFQVLWHILDGADGDLARRSGRASPTGELVDGVCDHISQASLYIAFAIILERSLGGWAWVLAVLAALSHFIQSNAYETGRKTYRHWVYGAQWMRQRNESSAGGLQRLLGRLYLALSNRFNPGEPAVEAVMKTQLAAGEEPARQARAIYRRLYALLVSRSGILGANTRTMASFLSILAGSPLWFFLFEILALNLGLAAIILARRRLDARLATSLVA